MGAFPQPRRNSAMFPLYPSATAGPRGDAGEGAHYQSSPGKSNQAARTAPLSINAFTPSKPFQCKQNPFRRPMGDKSHPGRPQPLPTCSRAESSPAPPGRCPPGKRSSGGTGRAAMATAAPRPCAPRANPSVALVGPPSPAGGSRAAGAAQRGAALGQRRQRGARNGSGAPSGRGTGAEPRGTRAEPPRPTAGRGAAPHSATPERPGGTRGRSIAPGSFLYSLISKEPFH